MSDNEKINADEFVRSLNGFDDIAIEQAFKMPFTKMDEMRGARALLFVKNRRDGMSDFDAFKNAMEVTLGELGDIFETEEDEPEAAQQFVDGPGN